jgi:hypothetical protein
LAKKFAKIFLMQASCIGLAWTSIGSHPIFCQDTPAGMPLATYLHVGCGTNHYPTQSAPCNASGLAFIDPVVRVAPNVMVNYNSTLMPAAKMYSIEYNPTMKPFVPFPPGVTLLLLSE